MNYIHVIIPVYNAKKYLRDTVQSVLNQPYKGIDIVLVDDGSTDGSSALCDEIALLEDRVAVMHQKNSGVSVARNAGIEYMLSRYEDGYIAFLDADDLWNSEFFNDALVNKLKEENETDVYVFGSVTSDEKCRRFSWPRRYSEQSYNGGNSVIWKAQGTFCANFYSIYMLRAFGIRFIEGLKYSEDKIFMLQSLFLARKVKFMPGVLHIYRENSSSVMRKVFTYSPVEYYTPIINGWIESDLFVHEFAEQTGKSTDAGFVLASIYFMDMACEHYKRWKNPKELENIKGHPYYHLFENMKQNSVSKKQYKDQQLLLNHPLLYRWKYRTIGAVEYAARVALRVKPVRAFRLKRKYPLLSVLDDM